MVLQIGCHFDFSIQCSIALHEPYLRLIERLLPIMPDPSLDSFFFWNSGSEAVEAAMKMARQLTKRQNIICMQGAYHGRTFGAMAVTKSKTIYSAGSHPLMVRLNPHYTLKEQKGSHHPVPLAWRFFHPLSILALVQFTPFDLCVTSIFKRALSARAASRTGDLTRRYRRHHRRTRSRRGRLRPRPT